jgi:rhamnosyl/mannosyltransferase
MRILHLGKYFPPEPGGMEAVVRSFSEATSAEHSNYCLVATRTGRTRVETSGSTTVHFLRQAGTILLTPVLPALPWVLHRLRGRERFPVILLHYPNPAAVLALFLTLLVRPKREKLVVWFHADILVEERWKRAIFSLYRPFEESVLRRADAFVGATPHHIPRSPVFRRFAERSGVIPYAVPDDWFRTSEAEAARGEEIRRSLGGRYVLFVGRLVPYKGLETLLRAAGDFPCRTVIVGTGPLEASLRSEIASRGLEGKVILAGGVEEIRPYYLGCEFLVLPSCSALEGFGIVQIEAMALGKPVVSSDLPTGVTYVNVDGETGLTFPVGNEAALAAACRRLLSDDALRIRLGAAARRRANELFSYGAMARQAADFMDRLRGEGAG